VSGAYGLRVEPDSVLDAGADPDLDFLVVPGGGWNDGNGDSGARGAANDDDLLATIRALHDTGTTLVSVCTGGMVLAAAGVLEGRPAVTHHGALEDLRESGAEVVEARVVDTGDVLTAAGVTAGIDLALHVLEREYGSETATRVAETIAHERRGPVVTTEE
jgi:transcriptional regulator GlxA family with amidase domain